MSFDVILDPDVALEKIGHGHLFLVKNREPDHEIAQHLLVGINPGLECFIHQPTTRRPRYGSHRGGCPLRRPGREGRNRRRASEQQQGVAELLESIRT